MIIAQQRIELIMHPRLKILVGQGDLLLTPLHLQVEACLSSSSASGAAHSSGMVSSASGSNPDSRISSRALASTSSPSRCDESAPGMFGTFCSFWPMISPVFGSASARGPSSVSLSSSNGLESVSSRTASIESSRYSSSKEPPPSSSSSSRSSEGDGCGYWFSAWMATTESRSPTPVNSL
ncbi:hypothetical protein [Nesterenkonia pannonica]|uniref:hypothetical protein n=1 Tax=Nesterenkonia pannonica TaxID=1548602 RepID=UPI0021640625|nr:hypothetical protein [Nesterenkonia pannonica]